MRSIFKKSIILNNLFKFWWVSALSTIVMFLAVPFVILERNVEVLIERQRYINLSTFLPQTLLIIAILSVVIGALITRYLQTSKSVTLLHSMPFTRGELYASNWLSGLILLVVPILINFLALISLYAFTEYGKVLLLSTIWKWLSITSSISLALYSISVMVGMFTGSSIAQILFTYILNALPLASIAGGFYSILGTLYGLRLELDGEFMGKVAKVMPLTQMFDAASFKAEEIIHIAIINAILTVVSIVIGYFVYKFRNLEKAGDVISNGVLKPIFKYGVTVCTMVLGTIYVKMITDQYAINFLWYVAFALLGYAIAQMLLVKSVKILKYWKGFVGYLAVFALLAIGIKVDILGFESRVPKVDAVEYATIDHYYNSKLFKHEAEGVVILKEKENIQKIANIHQYLINNKLDYSVSTTSIQIGYKLNNGRFIEREYYIERDNQLLEDIFSQDEYKIGENYFIFNKIETLPQYSISVSSGLGYTINIKEEDKKELIYNLRKDILNLNYSQLNDYPTVAWIEISYPQDGKLNLNTNSIEMSYIDEDVEYTIYGNSRSISINENYTNVLNYLTQKGNSVMDSSRVKQLAVMNDEGEIVKIITDSQTIKQIVENMLKAKYVTEEDHGELIYRICIYNDGMVIGNIVYVTSDDEFFIKLINE